MNIHGRKTNKLQQSCCALFNLQADSDASFEELSWQIERAKRESELKWTPDNRDSGERGCYTIVTPKEAELRKNLIKLKFEKKWEFPRRNGYPDGMLEFWALSW